MLSRTICIISSVIFFTTLILANPSETNNTSGRDLVDMPPYIRIVTDENDPSQFEIPDSIFYRIAGRTIFKVNRTELNLKDPLLIELAQRILPQANNTRHCLVGIELRGAASPEGPYQNNVRLSKGRQQALRDFLQQHLDSVQYNEVASSTIAEDYPYVLFLLEQADDPAAPIVREIIEDCGLEDHAKIKERMRKYDGGKMWNRLWKEYFPFTRTARVVLYFQKIRFEPVPTPEQPDPVLVYEPLEIPSTYEPIPLLPKHLVEKRRHMLSVSTNLLYDLFYMPNFGWAPMWNIGVEYYPVKGNFTIKGIFTSPYYHRWAKHKFFQIRDYHLEGRYYLNPGWNHTGWYVGAFAHATKYGIGFNKKKGWQGEGIGASAKLGYVLPLGDGRWRLDFHIAGGGFLTWYDPYVYGNPITGEETGDYFYDWTHGSGTFKKRQYRRSWLGPTELGVTVTFDVLYRKNLSKGVSFISSEEVY